VLPAGPKLSGPMKCDSDSELREKLQRDPRCRFVNFVEFSRLLVSRFPLERSYSIGGDMVGLLDRTTGVRFFIEFEKLQVVR
jgi:hypothetical protein